MDKYFSKVKLDVLSSRQEVDNKPSLQPVTYSDTVGPLHVAAMGERTEAAQKLLNMGSDPNAVSPQGTTPLHMAARHNSCAVARLLIQKGANRGAVDAASETPLTAAAALGHWEMVSLLLEDGAEANLEHRDSHGNTALHLAAAGDHMEAVSRLVTYKPNLWALNDLGETPLAVAKRWGSRRVSDFLTPRMAGRCWEKSAESLLLQHTDNDPALWVVQRQVQLLKQAGPEQLRGRGPDGKTLLHWAAIVDATDCAEYLLGWSMDVNAVDRSGASPLHYAALNDSAKVCDLLLNSRADVNLGDHKGLTPLMLCMIAGSESVATKLVKSGWVVFDQTDSEGETALMHVARLGSESLARLVIGGSTVLQKNHSGLTALEICEQHGHAAVSALLEAYRPSLDAYPRHQPKNGYCLVINQIHKTPILDDNGAEKLSMRTGSWKDVNRIFDLFQGKLNFKVHPRDDLASSDIIQELGKVSKSQKDIDYFVCFILAHGQANSIYGDSIYGTDNVLVPVKDIAQQVDAEHCSNLVGKPKIFFIQACREFSPQMDKEKIWKDPNAQSGQTTQNTYIDFFFGYSTWEDCLAYRRPSEGSVYIQTLCDVIEEDYKTKDLVKMMTRVCSVIGSTPLGKGSKGSNGNFMVPNIKSSLQKDVKF